MVFVQYDDKKRALHGAGHPFHPPEVPTRGFVGIADFSLLDVAGNFFRKKRVAIGQSEISGKNKKGHLNRYPQIFQKTKTVIFNYIIYTTKNIDNYILFLGFCNIVHSEYNFCIWFIFDYKLTAEKVENGY